MKRILAMLCVIACLCALCVPAMAAGNITVSVKAPADWAEVNLYVWDSNDQALAGWPGTAMTKGADGWWTLEIPAGYVNVIANSGNEKPQTVDLKMDGNSDAWITVTDDTGDGKHFNGVVYTDAACTKPFGGNSGNDNNNNGGNSGTGVDLSGLNSLALVGSGIPGVGEWDVAAAAGDMTKASNGVYTKVIAVTAGTTMMFKIAGNDAWDDAYNFGGAEDGVTVTLGKKVDLTNGGGSKDLSLSATKDCNLKFTVDLTGATPTLLVEETDEEASTTPGGSTSTPVDGPTVTVYAKVPASWSDVRVWCWNDSSLNPGNQGDWPGSFTMTKGDDGWYSVEIPQGYPNLLINANGGAAQTADITGAVGTTPVYIDALTDPAAPTVHNEKVEIVEPDPTEPPVATERPNVEPTEPAGTGTSGGSDNTVLLCIIGSVVIIAVAAVVFIILKKKKA